MECVVSCRMLFLSLSHTLTLRKVRVFEYTRTHQREPDARKFLP